MAVLTYSPLPSPTSIRLLKLHGQTSDGPIKCSLVTVDLSQPPEYIALSYACGDPSDKTEIVCNNETAHIPRNLHDALSIYKNTSAHIWADALCIEQSNLAEKARQVSMMGDVYRKATLVAIWLGHTEQVDAELFFEDVRALVEGLGKIHGFGGTLGHFDEDAADLHWNLSDHTKVVSGFPECGLFNPDAAGVSRLRRFFYSPWFSRVWVLQEAGLSSTAVLHWGSLTVGWDPVGITTMFLHRHCPRLLERLGLTQALRRAYQLYTCFSVLQPSATFLQVLNDTRDFQATDPRDKIFSLLSHPLSRTISWSPGRHFEVGPERKAFQDLAYQLLPSLQDQYLFRSLHERAVKTKDYEQLGPPLTKVDYTSSVEQVYSNFTKDIITRTQSLEILASVQHIPKGDNKQFSPPRPTWIPRWDIPPISTTLGLVSSSHTASANKDATFSFGSLSSSSAENSAHTPTLKATGIPISTLIGKVWNLTPALTVEDLEPPPSMATTTSRYSGIRPNMVALFWSAIGGPSANTHPTLPVFPNVGSSVEKAYAQTWVAGKNLSEIDGYDLENDSVAYWRRIAMPVNDQRSGKGDWKRYLRSASAVCKGRKVFTTSEGYLGLGPGVLRRGDQIAVLLGMDVPIVVRPMNDQSISKSSQSTKGEADEETKWELIGECYVHGLMQGQAVRVNLDRKDFVFV